jgi:hypothetical protein
MAFEVDCKMVVDTLNNQHTLDLLGFDNVNFFALI